MGDICSVLKVDWLEEYCLGIFEDPEDQGGPEASRVTSGVMWPRVRDGYTELQQPRNEKLADLFSLVHMLGMTIFFWKGTSS